MALETRSSLQRFVDSLMETAPLFPVALGLILGVVMDDAFHFSAVAYTGVFLVSASTAWFPRPRRAAGPLLVLVASATVGGILHANAIRVVPSTSIQHYTAERPVLSRLIGRILDEPRVVSPPPVWFSRWSFGADRTVFLFQAETLEGVEGPIAVTGRVRVSVAEPVPDLRPDDRVEVFGWLHRFDPPSNPGAFDHATYLRRQGVVAGLRSEHRENVKLLDASAVRRESPLSWFRRTVRQLLMDDRATAETEEQGLLDALILGHRSQLDRRLDEAFTRAGCVHFLAASGTNIVIVMLLARMLCPGFLFRPRTRVLAMLLATVLYALLAEPRPPILRAAVICGMYCLARLMGRQHARLNWISASVIILALVDPAMVFDAGYQLSYAATLGVSFLTGMLKNADRDFRKWWNAAVRGKPFREEDARLALVDVVNPSHWHRLRRWIGRLIRRALEGPPEVSLGAWLGTLPIVALHFLRVQLWGPISTLVLLPFVTVAMGLGFVKVVLSLISTSLGDLAALLLHLVIETMLAIVHLLAELPGASVAVPALPWWLIADYYAFLLACLWRFSNRSTASLAPRPDDHPPVADQMVVTMRRITGLTTLLLVAGFGLWLWSLRPDGRLVVTVLSVGAGSATVIELPDGRTVLYDAGSNRPYDVGRSVVVPFLRQRGVRRIEKMYISHPNLDHYNGVPGVIDEFPVGSIVVNEYFPRDRAERPPVRQFLKILREHGQNVELLKSAQGTRWELGSVTFELLWPPPGLPETVSPNDSSTVLRLSYRGRSILLPGDIEQKAQRSLLDRGDLHADVLVLPHHGGLEPTSTEFFRAVSPRIAIRSSHQGVADGVGPLPALVAPARLYNTADAGAVQVVMDDPAIHCSTSRSKP